MIANSNSQLSNDVSGNSIQSIESDEVNNMFRTLSNFNIRHKFSNSIQFNMDYDFINFNRNNPTSYVAHNTNLENNTQSEEQFNSSAKTPLNIHVIKSDVTITHSKKLTVETGLKFTFSEFENSVIVADLQGEEYVDNPNFTQVYAMDENINAAYLSVNWQAQPKLLVKAGLRYEDYNLQLSSNTSGPIIDTEKGNIFPSVFLHYKVTKNSEWNMSYVQRVQRPGFLQLAPYFYFFNENSLFTGNPNLAPAFSTQYRLGYRYKLINLTVEYAHIQDPIYDWQPRVDQEQQIAIFGPSQGLEGNIYSVSLSLPWAITDKWESNIHMMGYYRKQTPIIEGQHVVQKSNDFSISMGHSYEVIQKWFVEINTRYTSAHYNGVAKIHGVGGLNAGVQHKLKNGMAFSFNVNDIFNTSSQWPITADLPNQGFYYNWEFDGEGPVFRMNVSMPIGNKNLGQKKNRKSGSSEELRRL
jgi:outer membrane receptor protein involved in Fe transport